MVITPTISSYSPPVYQKVNDNTDESFDPNLEPHGKKNEKVSKRIRVDTSKWKIVFRHVDERDLKFEEYLHNAFLRQFTRELRDRETLPIRMAANFAPWKQVAATYSIAIRPSNNTLGWEFGIDDNSFYIPFRLLPFFSGSYTATRDFFLARSQVSWARGGVPFSNKWQMHQWATQQPRSVGIHFPIWLARYFRLADVEPVFMVALKAKPSKERPKMPAIYVNNKKVTNDKARAVYKQARAKGSTVLTPTTPQTRKADDYFPFKWDDTKRTRFGLVHVQSPRLKRALRRYTTRDVSHYPHNVSYRKAIKMLETIRVRDDLEPHGIDDFLTFVQNIDEGSVPYLKEAFFATHLIAKAVVWGHACATLSGFIFSVFDIVMEIVRNFPKLAKTELFIFVFNIAVQSGSVAFDNLEFDEVKDELDQLGLDIDPNELQTHGDTPMKEEHSRRFLSMFVKAAQNSLNPLHTWTDPDEKLQKRFHTAVSQIHDLKSLVVGMTSAAKSIYVFIRRDLGAASYDPDNLSVEAEEFCTEAAILLQNTVASMTPDVCDSFYALWLRGHRLRRNVAMARKARLQKGSAILPPALLSLMEKVEKQMHLVFKTLNESRPRVEPSMHFIFGKKAVGKTAFARWEESLIISEVMGNQASPKHRYIRNLNEEFFDGYTPWKVTISYDDALQDAREEKRTVLITEQMDMTSNNPINLDMADLSEKGMVYARPRAIVNTSNVNPFLYQQNTAPPGVSVQDFGAYLRRIDLGYEPISIDDREPLVAWMKQHGQPTIDVFDAKVVMRVVWIGGISVERWKTMTDLNGRTAHPIAWSIFKSCTQHGSNFYLKPSQIAEASIALLRAKEVASKDTDKVLTADTNNFLSGIREAGRNKEMFQHLPFEPHGKTKKKSKIENLEEFLNDIPDHPMTSSESSSSPPVKIDKSVSPSPAVKKPVPKKSPGKERTYGTQKTRLSSLSIAHAEEPLPTLPDSSVELFDFMNQLVADVMLLRPGLRDAVQASRLVLEGVASGQEPDSSVIEKYVEEKLNRERPGLGQLFVKGIKKMREEASPVVKTLELQPTSILMPPESSAEPEPQWVWQPGAPAYPRTVIGDVRNDKERVELIMKQPPGTVFFEMTKLDIGSGTLYKCDTSEDPEIRGHVYLFSSASPLKLKFNRVIGDMKSWIGGKKKEIDEAADEFVKKSETRRQEILDSLKGVQDTLSTKITDTKEAIVTKVAQAAEDAVIEHSKLDYGTRVKNGTCFFIHKILGEKSPEWVVKRSQSSLMMDKALTFASLIAGSGIIALIAFVAFKVRAHRKIEPNSLDLKERMNVQKAKLKLAKAYETHGSFVEHLNAVVHKNVYAVYSGPGRIGWMLSLGLGWCVMPLHLFEAGNLSFRSNPCHNAAYRGETQTFNKITDVRKAERTDRVYFRVPGICSPKIVSRLLTLEDLNKSDWKTLLMVAVPVPKDGNFVSSSCSKPKLKQILSYGKGKSYTLPTHISCVRAGYKGESGAPAFTSSNTLGDRCLIGYHAAGTRTADSVIAPLIREEVLEIVPELHKKYRNDPMKESEYDPHSADLFYSTFQGLSYLGEVPRSKAHFEPGVTRIEPSPLNPASSDFVGIEPLHPIMTEPCFMKTTVEGDRVFDPFISWSAKTLRVKKKVPEKMVTIVSRRLLNYIPPPVVNEISDEQVLNGFTAYNLKPIDPSTSAGFDYAQRPGVKGKTPYLVRNDKDELVKSPEFQAEYDKMLAGIKSGDRMRIVMQVHRKDERINKIDKRPPEKELYFICAPALSGKTTICNRHPGLAYDIDDSPGYISNGLFGLGPDLHAVKSWLKTLPFGAVVFCHSPEEVHALGEKVSCIVFPTSEVLRDRGHGMPVRHSLAVRQRERLKNMRVTHRWFRTCQKALRWTIMKTKCRMFYGCSLMFLILYRRAFAELMVSLRSMKWRGPITLGMDEASSDWHYMVRELSSVCLDGDPRVLDDDVSSWDMDSDMFTIVTALVRCCEWYQIHLPKNPFHFLRRWIVDELQYVVLSICMHGSTVYASRYNQFPSGFADTTAINGLCNILRSETVIVGAGLAARHSWSVIYEALDHQIKQVVNGDDSLIVIDPAITWFDRIQRKVFLEAYFQMKLTSATKGEVQPGSTTFAEAQYNSHLFSTLRGEPIQVGVVTSLLKPDSLFDIPMYVTTSQPREVAFVQNLESAARYLAFYTPESCGNVRQDTMDYWNRALRKLDLPMIRLDPEVVLMDYLLEF